MSTCKWIVVAIAATGTCGAADMQQSPHFGRAVTQTDLAAWDISIAPDGTGLPPGSGTAKQGEVLFAAKCAACHGPKGTGPVGPPPLGGPLVGGAGTLTGDKPVKTVGSFWPYATTLFDYVRRAMPFTQPQSLSNDEVYALAAYILSLNGIIDDKEVMNAKTLPKVKMPNRAKFFSVYPNSGP
jgi:S-disulfanyl-L-cysteine oxidoreductase SoxD